jgi:hypothetical protein
MHAFVQSVLEWFKSGSHLAWALLVLTVGLDILFAHSKNQKLNHAAGFLALIIQKIADLLQISKIPAFGPALTGLLNLLIGVPAGGLPAPAAAPVSRANMDTPPERPAGLPPAA